MTWFIKKNGAIESKNVISAIKRIKNTELNTIKYRNLN